MRKEYTSSSSPSPPRLTSEAAAEAPFEPVYINTSMIQKALARPRWAEALTSRDYAALAPLIWAQVNPYGRFDLDMDSRLALL